MSQRILVIDDEQDIRSLLTLILESAGYTVQQARSGKEGLTQLEREPADLVLLDIMMPEMDGWEVCRQIKNRAATRNTPVIILTVRSQPLDKVIGTEVVHADEYLTKPFDRRVLLKLVHKLLGEPLVAAEQSAAYLKQQQP
jgi:DNA-binding response OmpR family regulator